MGHTEVVNLVRAAPPMVELVVGRVLEAPRPPIEAHMLPDICLKGKQEPLGKDRPPLRHYIKKHPWHVGSESAILLSLKSPQILHYELLLCSSSNPQVWY